VYVVDAMGTERDGKLQVRGIEGRIRRDITQKDWEKVLRGGPTGEEYGS